MRSGGLKEFFEKRGTLIEKVVKVRLFVEREYDRDRGKARQREDE